LILVLSVLIIAGSCATGKKAYVAKEDEELFGTWINTDYDEVQIAAKIIFDPNGVVRAYPTVSITKEWMIGKFTISDKWIDAEGNIWYKWLRTEAKGMSMSDTSEHYYLGKISDSGRVLELNYSGYDYPTEVNPDSLKYAYSIYYRQ
jgi:hypothetical protein